MNDKNAKTVENGKTEFVKKVEAFARELQDTFHNDENETKGLIILCVDDNAVDDTKKTATTVVLGKTKEVAPMLGEFLKDNEMLAALAYLYAQMPDE